MLSRLALSEEEIEMFADQLSDILDYAKQLEELDTSQVEPIFYPIPLHNVFREDSLGEPLPIAEVLSNTVRAHDTFFEVPKVVDGS